MQNLRCLSIWGTLPTQGAWSVSTWPLALIWMITSILLTHLAGCLLGPSSNFGSGNWPPGTSDPGSPIRPDTSKQVSTAPGSQAWDTVALVPGLLGLGASYSWH